MEGKIMSKKWDFLIVIIGLIIVYFTFHLHPITKTVATNKEIKSKHDQPKVTLDKKTKAKTTMEMADPLLDCSNEADLCEKAILPSKQEFSYSDYIWADKGELVTFAGTSMGNDEMDVWVESDDGSFSSDIGVIPSNKTTTFTVVAPFDGNYRLVIQNKSTNFTGSGTGYIEDAWSE
jgi:hypothetical protein